MAQSLLVYLKCPKQTEVSKAMRQGRSNYPPPPARRGGRAICEAKRIWSHYLALETRNAFRPLQRPRREWPGFPLDCQLMRLCSFAEQIALPPPTPARVSRQRTGNLLGKAAPGINLPGA